MNIKTKKIKLTKILIGSSLLLATASLPFALTSCGKKSTNGGGDDNDPHSTSYLFKLEPKVFGEDGKETNENLVLENATKELLDKTKGYNENFLSQLDLSFENHKFEKKDENNKDIYNDITATLGDLTVYYLNTNNLDDSIAFDINEQMLSKCGKIDEVKKYINFSLLDKQKVQGEEKPKLIVQSVDEKNNDLSFYGENDKKEEVKIDNDNDVSKIKKAKITFPQTISTSLKSNGLCGLLITFNPIDGDDKKVKTVVIKFVKNDNEFKYLNKKSYDDFNKDIDEMTNDYFIMLEDIGGTSFDKYITGQLNIDESTKDESTKDESTKDKSTPGSSFLPDRDADSKIDFAKIATQITTPQKNKEWKFNSGDFFEEGSEKSLDVLKKYLKENLSLVLDEEKSKEKKTLCFDTSSLLDKKEYQYLLCIKKSNNDKYNSKDISVHYGENGIAKDGEYGTYDIKIGEKDIKEGKFVAKFVIKQLDLEFISKNIELTFKK